jgi:F-type H+-transporting ATPase subunit b
VTAHAGRRARVWSFLLLSLLSVSCALGPRVWAQASPSEPGPGASEQATPINAVPEKRAQEKDETEEYRHSAMVQKFGHMLGMNAEQAATAFTVVNFLILVVGLGYLALKILPRVFKDRSSAIQRHLVEARTATEEASARLKAVEARLGRLDEDIAGMRRQAEADAEREDRRAQTTLEQESAKIVAAAENEIQAAAAAARRDLQRHAAELAVDQAARKLVISAETDRLLVEGFAQQLAGKAGGQN